MGLDFIKQFANPVSQEEEDIIRTLTVIMERFGYNHITIKDLPIPTYLYLIKILKKEQEEMEKKNKR